jgi:hypothetical protein
MNIAINLLESWARHIKEVFERRGRSDVYQLGGVPQSEVVQAVPNLEVFHTCHGCGAGAVPSLTDGLCPACYSALQDARLSAKLFKRDTERGR